MKLTTDELIDALKQLKFEVEWHNPVTREVVEERKDGFKLINYEKHPNKRAMARADLIQQAVDRLENR